MKYLTFESSKYSIWLLIPIFISLIASGCASNPKAINILRNNEQITIQSPATNTGKYEFTFSNEEFKDSVSTGAATGAGIGGLIGALSCGPLWVLCAGVGAVIYGAGGGVVGAVVGVTTDLSVYKTENVKAINSKIDSYITSNNPQNEFLAFVKKNAGERYQITSSAADTKITVLFSAMGLNHQGDDIVVLITQSYVTVNFIDGSGKPQEVSQMYQYISPPNHINSWVNEDETFYQMHFDKAYRTMAENIMMTLAY